MYDGWLRIKITGDTKEFEKQLKSAEKDLDKFKKENQKLTEEKAKLELDISPFEKDIEQAKKGIKDLEKSIENMENKRAKLLTQIETERTQTSGIYASARQTELQTDYTKLTEKISEAKTKLVEFKNTQKELPDKYYKMSSELTAINEKIEENISKQNITKNNIKDITNKIETAGKLGDLSTNLEEAQSGFKNIGNGIEKITKKMVKWGLAVFSIRSAYNFVRRSVSTILQYDDQMNADIEYIRYALAMTIKPIVEWLINGAYKLMTYVNYISQAWFGVNLFKNAGIEDYNKAIDKSNKKTKELKKTLAGFDEINVLSSNKDTTDKITTPSFNLGEVKQIDVPDWVKWIADNKEAIIQLAEIVGIAFAGAKVKSILGGIASIFGVAGAKGVVGGTGLAGLFSSLGAIALVAGGIAIVAYVTKSTWDDTKRLAEEIDKINEKTHEANKEWQKSLDPVNDLDTELKTISTNITNGEKTLKNSNNWWIKMTGTSDTYLKTATHVSERSKETLETLEKMYKAEGRTNEEKRKIIDMLWRQIDYNNTIISELKEEGKDSSQIEQYNKDILTKIKEMRNEQKNYNKDLDDTKTKSGNIFTNFSDIFKKVFDLENLKIGDKTFNVKDNISSIITNLSNLNKKKVNDKTLNINAKVEKSQVDNLAKVVSGIVGSLQNLGYKIQTSSLANSISKFRDMIGLAGGGIVNLPGRGVPISNVRTGEAGREGVLPLSNPEAMSTLGREIGKWVTIENIINNYMDASKINTILEQSKNRQNMMRNGV